MKRWPLRIAVCLILGAITTVAVAWGSSLTADATQPPNLARLGHQATRPPHDFWWVNRHDWHTWTSLYSVRRFRASGMGISESHQSSAASLLPTWSNLGEPNQAYFYFDASSEREDRYNFGFGWPTRAFWCEYARTSNDAFVPMGLAVIREAHIDPNTLWEFPVGFPLRPIWPGFVIDTLFYAAIWFGVFFGFASAKRFIRIKRGRCPRCGYDLRGQRLATSQEPPANSQIRCPECGRNHSGD